MPISRISINVGGYQRELEADIPNICPHCITKIRPHVVSNTSYSDSAKPPIAVLYQCTECNKYFAVEYVITGPFQANKQAYEAVLVPYTYKTPVEFDLPLELADISPTFKDIYIQSLTAENDGLNLISGIGFRKAIEYLIKDFLINFLSKNNDDIVKLPLLQAINMLDSEKIKSLSVAAVWIGNDETHYLRKFEDKDVSDMKRFIRALAFYISSEIVASEAKEFTKK